MSQPDESESASASASNTLPWARPNAPERDLTGATLGDFIVERLLGRGGMGEVYLARQISLNRPAALKVLRPDLLTRPTYLSRFEAEATAVAKLNHPNIVHVYTLGSTDGVRFIAMEYVQGTNLREFLRRKGALDYPLALSVMKQAGMAVGAAGEIGLIHRDIKPENLLMTRKGQVKIADFGLCRDLDRENVNLTQSGVTMGTPLYMSPEQAQGHALDHRSDLYSLGVTFYHMLAGVPPFHAETALALALKHVREKPVSLAVHRPDIPPELDRLVLKLMAKSPVDRYQSAAEMLRDLARVRESLQTPTGPQAIPDVSAATAASPLNGAAAVAPSPTPVAVATEAASRPSGSALRTRFLTPDGSAPRLGKGAKAALVALSLAVGAAAGWLNRPEDLLSASSPRAAGMPGLWINPGWKEVPVAASAEAQFRHAQIVATPDEREAAWLAVPGRFSSSREWASRAYTQLARHLLRRRDVDRLRALAGEIDQWADGQTHDKELAAVTRAGVLAVEGDLDGVLNALRQPVELKNLTDPALLELCLEVTRAAERDAVRSGALANKTLARDQLRPIQQEVASKLYQTELREPPLNRPRPG
jgi:serine/threonine-protein kinase